MDFRDELNTFFVDCFYSILSAEEKNLEAVTNGAVTLKEIHLIEAVFQSKQSGENNFSTIAKKLKVTPGTLATAFAKLEKKGYLVKEQDKKDKRIFYVNPTRLAEFINNEHTKFHEKLIEGVSCALSDEEQHNLAHSLKHLKQFFDNLNYWESPDKNLKTPKK